MIVAEEVREKRGTIIVAEEVTTRINAPDDRPGERKRRTPPTSE
jgi:hypothetical protein